MLGGGVGGLHGSALGLLGVSSPGRYSEFRAYLSCRVKRPFNMAGSLLRFSELVRGELVFGSGTRFCHVLCGIIVYRAVGAFDTMTG